MDELVLKISGRDIYKAVDNYLKNTIPKRAITQEVVDQRLQERLDHFVNQSMEKLTKVPWAKNKSTLDEMVEKAVKDHIQKNLSSGILDQLIKKALS